MLKKSPNLNLYMLINVMLIKKHVFFVIVMLNTNEKRKDTKVVKTKWAFVIKKCNVIQLQGYFIVATP